MATRRRRRALLRSAGLFVTAVATTILAVATLPAAVAAPIVMAGAFGIWRSFAGMESAATERAWMYRNQAYQ